MDWSGSKLLAIFLLPPLNALLLGTAGLLLLKNSPRVGKLLMALSLLLLYLLSTPFFTARGLNVLETPPLHPSGTRDMAQAIVVLGAGTYFHAPDYGSDTVNRLALERLRYAARLYRVTAKPVLVSGGKAQGSIVSEAAQMKSVLENEFGVPVTWEEPASETTFESALDCRSILKPAGISRIYLVTHAWHMRRAELVFKAAGFDVVPAATGYTTLGPDPLQLYVPNPQGLFEGYLFIHEVVGLLWYQIRISVKKFMR